MADRSSRSSLYVLEPIVRKLPEVRSPKRHISFKEKLMWSGIALIIYLVMSQITLFGLPGEAVNYFGDLQYVLASQAGTLMQLGISPIVTSGIIMQLLAGANILNIDLHHSRDRALFTGTQKILALIVGAFQASAFVFSGALGGGTSGLGLGMMSFLVLQLVIGVTVVLFLDETVSKYGFGSGISLFIAGGVSAAVFWQAFNPTTAGGVYGGAIPNFISSLMQGAPSALHGAFFRTPLPNMMGVIATLVIFLIVIYAVNVRVEIPLSYSRYGGMRGKYPIKLLYASVIPVILSSVVFTNVSIMARVTNISFLGRFSSGGSVTGGLYYYLTPPSGINQLMQEPFRALIYLAILVLFCMGFAWLWVQMTNMAPSDVADQLKRSGMSIPGFRRDTRIMENMLSRYITPVTLLGGAFVGALAAGADFLGALGSGTGILLTVSIVYRLYQELAREQLSEMFPAARRLLGES